jgi:hypothetical protein
MMMLHDYVSKRWLYTGANDVMRLERDDGSVLGEEALALVMGKLSPSSVLPTTLYGPGHEDVAAGDDAFDGQHWHCTSPEG